MTAKIFVLEDEQPLREMLSQELSLAGHVVQSEPTLADFRAHLSKPAPDLVLLDLNLPDGNSLTLLPEIRKHWPRTGIVILTGFATQEAADEAYKQADVFLLSKPFDSELLQGVIDMALTRKK